MVEDPGAEAAEGDRAPWSADELLLALVCAATVGVVLVLFHVDYFPTLDGPHHLFLGYLENHFHDPGAGWPAWLERGSPFTALGFHLVFSPAERFLGWRTAFQVTLCVIALAWAFGYLALARALHPRRAALGLLGFATSIPWLVHMGFFSFAMSVAIGFWILAVALGAQPWTMRRRALLTGTLLAQAVAHAFGAVLTGLVLVSIVALAREPRGPRARALEIGKLALMGLPALLIAATAADETRGHTGWLSLADHFSVLPRTFLPGPLWRAWPPLLLGLAGMVVALVRSRRGRASRAELALGVASGLCLALAFATPMDLPAWQLFSPRFLPCGCMLGAALLPVERLEVRWRRAAALALSVFTAASLIWAARAIAALRAQQDEALSGLPLPIHRTGPRLVVSVDAFAAQAGSEHLEIPYDAPLFDLGPLYAIAQGGIPPFAFLSNPRLHSFVLSEQGKARHPPLFDPGQMIRMAERAEHDPAAREKLVTFLALVGAPFEDIVLHGRPEDGDVLEGHGYVPDFRHGGLFIGHLDPCPVTARVVTPAPWPARMVVEYGPEPLAHVQRRATLPPVPAGGAPEISRDVPLSPPLCGPMWLRVAPHPEDAHGLPEGGTVCEGADGKGRLGFVAKRGGGQVVECRIARDRAP